MANDDSSDFTFCQVSPPVDQFNLESPKSLKTIQTLKLEETSNPAPKLEASSSTKVQDTQTENSTSDLIKPSSKADVAAEKDKKPSEKKVVRKKVPFEKGYSQMDWLKLTQTHPDLAGLKGRSNRRLITMDEIKQHKNTEGAIWTVLKGRVYNMSPYLKFHPGGDDMLMKAAGKDCTSLFNKYHAWVNAEFLMEKCLVGFLDVNE
ncbi:hypothetical protein LUZ60_011389 [Juncus effusus]|nr:hypothetical protein LUZ60_011389 [Juncus effusus]